MKKLSFCLMMMLLSLNIFPKTINTAEKSLTTPANNTNEMPAEVKKMLNRLDEIKKIDKTSLSSVEKKALRKEVRTINSQLRTTNNGIYLSVGAIIIIILLLILLI
jgi:hypothetical protein